MIVQVSSDAPFVVKAAAATVLYLHIGGASLGLVSGAMGLVTRKGGRLHRAAGKLFVVSMLTMSAAAAIAAPLLPDRISGMMGVFTFYLTATAWGAVRRAPGTVGRFEVAAMFAALGIVAAQFGLAGIGAMSPKGLVDGKEPFQIALVFGAVAAVAAGLDLRVVRAGGLAGDQRIARHLWRMCLAFFIVWASFTAQAKAVPEALRGSLILFAPAPAALAYMVFWLVRLRVQARRRPAHA